MRRSLGCVMASWVLLAGVAVGPAGAATQAPADGGHAPAPQSQVEHRPAIATFEGRRIDLAGDWGDAHACLIWRQGGVMECFRTDEAMDKRAQELSPGRTAAAGGSPSSGSVTAYSEFSCSSSLSLYDGWGYGGRRVSFWDRGWWQNLGDYGFDNAASSYIVGGCYVHLADYGDGAGWWYPGDTSPYHGEYYMSSGWDNQVSSIYLE